MDTDNPMLYKLGQGITGRLGLGGANAGQTGRATNDLA